MKERGSERERGLAPGRRGGAAPMLDLLQLLAHAPVHPPLPLQLHAQTPDPLLHRLPLLLLRSSFPSPQEACGGPSGGRVGGEGSGPQQGLEVDDDPELALQVTLQLRDLSPELGRVLRHAVVLVRLQALQTHLGEDRRRGGGATGKEEVKTERRKERHEKGERE